MRGVTFQASGASTGVFRAARRGGARDQPALASLDMSLAPGFLLSRMRRPVMTPPSIDRPLLQKLADLARLHVPSDRQAALLQNLTRIVAAFDALRALPTPPPRPTETPTAAAPLREDQAEPPLPTDDVLANAPQRAGGMFVVPRVVDA